MFLRVCIDLGHAYRAGVNLSDALVGFVSSFPHPVILRGTGKEEDGVNVTLMAPENERKTDHKLLKWIQQLSWHVWWVPPLKVIFVLRVLTMNEHLQPLCKLPQCRTWDSELRPLRPGCRRCGDLVHTHTHRNRSLIKVNAAIKAFVCALHT